MHLEDFFTLAEMKDGLSTLDRVEELVSMMQKQRNYLLNKVDGSTQQWSAIACTLAATENKDCLDHFVELNGLCYLNQCLHEAVQKCAKVDVGEPILEESITQLLTTCERLLISREKLSASGIGVTIEQFLGHKNIKIKQKAKVLTEKWSRMGDDVSRHPNIEDKGQHSEDQPKLFTDVDGTKRGTGGASCDLESTGTESQHSNATRCSGSSPMGSAEDVKSISDQIVAATFSNSTAADATALGDGILLASPLVSNSCNSCMEILTVEEESSVRHAVESASSIKDVEALKEVLSGVEEMEVDVNSKAEYPYNFSRKSSSSGSSASLPVEKAALEPAVSCDFNSKAGESCLSNTRETRARDPDLKATTGADIAVDPKSEVGFEYEEMDALEVARQVAIEVEREVVDYREPFCSSPEVVSGDTTGTCCHGSVEDEQAMEEARKEQLPNDASSPKDLEEHGHISEPAKEDLIEQASVNVNRCDFDLNEDLFTEEFSYLSAPVAIVAASKGARSLPANRLQFEGEMGWKGSAATSAFRAAAAPHKTPERKQKPTYLEIDLNVAEIEFDSPPPAKQLPVSCGFPSGESSIEVSSRIAERLKLDLNRLGDDDTPSWMLHNQQNRDQNLSSASSSSSRQPSMRDFDLNDNLCVPDDISTFKKPDDSSAVKIMGSRMAVECPSFMMGTYGGHMPPPSYGCAMPLHPSLFGHGAMSFPYMVDSRGTTTIVPQILGSNGSLYMRPPFGLDLNSGMMEAAGGMEHKQFFIHGNSSGVVDGQARVLSQQQQQQQPPSGSMKRKEPDRGWESYAALGYNTR